MRGGGPAKLCFAMTQERKDISLGLSNDRLLCILQYECIVSANITCNRIDWIKIDAYLHLGIT